MIGLLKKLLYVFFIFIPVFLLAQRDDKVLHKLLDGKDYKKQIGIYDSLVKNLKSNNLPLSIEYMTMAIEIAKRNNNELMAAKSLNSRCKLYRHTSEFDKAEADLNEALPIFIKHNDKKWIVLEYTDFGNINTAKGIYDRAIAFYMKGLKIAEEINDHYSVAALNNNIGNVYYFEEKYTKAIEYYLKAYEMLKNIGDVKGSAMTLDNIGLIYSSLKQFEKALQYQTSALEIIKTLNDKQLLADSYMQLGGLYSEMKLHNKALEYFYKANTTYKETGTKYGLAQSGVNIGDVYRVKHQYKEAIAILNESYLMSKNIGSLGVSQSAAQNLYQTYEDMNDYKSAYKYYKEYVKLKDSVFNEESLDKINELSTKYETTQKLKEIEILTKDKELNATKLKQKNTLNTFLFSGIALVIALLSLLFYRFKEKQKANNLLEEKNNAIHEQKVLLEKKQDEILDSINYAKRLQGAILLSEKDLGTHFKEIFVLYKPKDIVGGDFYWFSESEHHKILAVADCTEHGVPGGFMCMIGYESLQDVALRKEITTPSQALRSLDIKITDSLNKS